MMAGQDGYLPLPRGFATGAIHNFQEPERWESMAVVPPLVTSTTFKKYTPTKSNKYTYGRCGNPNRDILEKCLASMDNGKYGLCFSSGVGATTIVGSFLKPGDHIVSCDHVYVGTNTLFNEVFRDRGIDTSFVSEDKIEEVIQPNTKLIWVESLTNPTMRVIDIRKVANIAHKHNSLLVVDNTFMSPYFQRPLDLGADIVLHSITKYINGHSDVTMGVVITNNEEIYKKLKFLQEMTGVVPSPVDCFQVTRSIKTLALRMKQHMKNSLEVAKFLEKHPKVEKVLHPGLPSHPQHELFKSQCSGCSGMLSFYLKGGKEESRRFLQAIKVFTLAISLGDVESLAAVPCLTTHSGVPEDQKKRLGISDNLIRMSVGIEDTEDLLADLEQALEKV